MVVARWVEPRMQTGVEVPAYLKDLVVDGRATPDQARGLIYRALVRAANRSMPCPSQWVLAIICGYDSAVGTVAPMQKLEQRGLIKVARYQRSRQVTICNTGRSTRACQNTSPHWRERSIHSAAEEVREA